MDTRLDSQITMTHSEHLKTLIEDFSATVLKVNPFAVAAKNGTLEESHVVTYLTNLVWIFQQHSAKLLPAIEKARILGQNEVVQFMEEKYAEELDHYQWPQEDLKNRGVMVDAKSDAGVTPSARGLISHIEALVEKDPTLFISYMVLVEYFTVLAAPEFLKNIELNCGITSSQLTAISKHIEADEKHVVDDFEVISLVVHGADQEAEMTSSLKQGMVLVDQFLSECAGVVA